MIFLSSMARFKIDSPRYELKALGNKVMIRKCIYSKFKYSIASSRVLEGVGDEEGALLCHVCVPLPTGSLILRFMRALFFIPTTLKRILMALAVLPARPITLPMSSGWT